MQKDRRAQRARRNLLRKDGVCSTGAETAEGDVAAVFAALGDGFSWKGSNLPRMRGLFTVRSSDGRRAEGRFGTRRRSGAQGGGQILQSDEILRDFLRELPKKV